jgi:hypothetical protein
MTDALASGSSPRPDGRRLWGRWGAPEPGRSARLTPAARALRNDDTTLVRSRWLYELAHDVDYQEAV